MSGDYEALHDLLVEWVAEHAVGATEEANVASFGKEHGLDLPQSFALLSHAVERGMVHDRYSTYGSPTAGLTAAGRQWLAQRIARRNDMGLRAAAARTAVLRFLWRRQREGGHFPVVSGVLQAPEGLFEGQPLTAEEIDREAGYLLGKKLIHGVETAQTRGPVRAETTPEGDDCVENYGGSVTDYLRRGQSPGSTTIHIGTNTGNVAANSRDVQMSATTSQGMDAEAVVLVIRAIRQGVGELGLNENDAAELVEDANRIEAELTSDQPDVSRVQRLGRNLLALLNTQAVSGALGEVLSTGLQQAIPGLS